MEKGNIVAEAKMVLPLIQKHLYPRREVFLRELISNSVDALEKLKVVRRTQSVPESEIGELRIDVSVDRSKSTISVNDNGIGMTRDDIKQYINRVAVSGAADFLSQYESAEDMIGCFGIGFYSVFLVARAVTIRTKSYLDDESGCVWRNQGDDAYELDTCKRSDHGTEVVLEIGQDHDEFLNPDRIADVVRKYCDFVPFPVYLNGEIANSIEAPWHSSRATLPAQAYRDFYKRLFEGANECRFWVRLDSDYPVVLRGILYVPYQPTEAKQISLFCNRVFVDDQFDELIPSYLGFLRGVLDVEGLPLNLSREKIRDHVVVTRIRSFIGKAVADEFVKTARTRRQDYVDMWTAYERPLKIAAMEDERWVEAMYRHFLFPCSSRGGYTTIEEYLTRNETTHPGVVYYLTDSIAQAAFLEQFRVQNKEVLSFTGQLDLLLLDRVRKQMPNFAEFRRIDFEPKPTPHSPAQLVEDEAAQETFIEFFATFCCGASVTMSSGVAADFPVYLQRKGTDSQTADYEDILRQFEKRGVSRTPEEWQVILNSQSPLVQNLLRIHEANRKDPLLVKTCELLYQQAAMKFGLTDQQDTATILSQTEKLLTWLCEQHAGSLTKR